jgi:phosphodiesterase/alkaline phosphatase D-like protein
MMTITLRPLSPPNSSAARFPPTDRHTIIAKVLPDNPHVHFFDSRRRGYVVVDLAAEAMQTQMRVVSDARDPKATIATLRTFAVESGRAGVVQA